MRRAIRVVNHLRIAQQLRHNTPIRAFATRMTESKDEKPAWFQSRLKNLVHDNGWLTLCGLSWLNEGENSLGSDEKSVVVLPKSCPATAGNIVLGKDGSTSLVPAAGVQFSIKGVGESKDKSIALQSDAAGSPTVAVLPGGDVSFFIIKRDTKFGVRMKDRKNAAFLNFKGIELFPVSSDWVKAATYHPFEKVKTMDLINGVGLNDPQRSPGYLEFEHEGKKHTLDVIDEDGEPDRYWIMFKDATNGKQTYGFRYMYCERPKAGSNTTHIDFNRAYNPPCAFTPYATCALPPKQNRLPFAVAAGEKIYEDGAH